MGRKKYLIDTNVAIEYFGETLPENVLASLDNIIDNQLFVSVINSLAELFSKELNFQTSTPLSLTVTVSGVEL